ncbi:ribonuclease YeeF family protein [Halalkalibacterium halodurans]|uniref:ribonuclease YeeF family protein n=2 Tax=Halalkalibacterium halodurans TaxID=86665 RepID=UPI002AAA09AE|nr:T7SS effector LXG polymorphic toxin [Halalkalibacterium halodurans]MDY7240720.1 T7SS effector LXG polymorphic toxin [Halalkalibacterium halodurans]
MKFLDVNQHLSELDEHIKVLKSYGDVFEEVEARITRVINMDGAFKGEGAQGVINNHAHVQLPTIRSIRAFLISYAETLEKMKANITEYEPASNGSVSEDFWKNQLPKGYDRYEEKLEEREATINQATAEVSHILHLGKLQTGDVYNSVDSARKHADTVLEGLYDLDQAGVELMAQVRTKMEELKATIRQVLDWTMTGGVTMKGVSIMEVGGYFANNATLHEKAPEVDTSNVSVGVYDPALADNPSLVQMRLDAKYGNPVSNGKDLSEAELKGEVPESVIEYIFNNSGKIGIDLAVNSTAGAIKYIGHETKEIAKEVGKIGANIKSIGDLFSRLSRNVGSAVTTVGKAATTVSNFITKTGQFVQGAGRALGGGFIAVSAGFGFYEDVTEKGKTVGEAVAHNGASVGVGLGAGALGAAIGTGLATFAAVSNPVGWAVVGGVAVGAVATWGFNYMYDNNILGLQDGLDAVGRKLDDIGESIGSFAKDAGEAISNGLKAINPMNWGW